MRYVILLATVLVASTSHADQLATLVRASFNHYEMPGSIRRDDILVNHQGFGFYQVVPFGDAQIGVTVPFVPSPVMPWHRGPEDRFMTLEILSTEGMRSVISDVLMDQPVGEYSYGGLGGSAGVMRLLPLAGSPEPKPYSSATWTIDSFLREPNPLGGFDTSVVAIGRYYIVPEPSVLASFLLGLCVISSMRGRNRKRSSL